MSIMSELDYLSVLLNQSSKTTSDLSIKIGEAIKSIEIPPSLSFDSIEDADLFLCRFQIVMFQVLRDLSEIVAASYVDDLGGQSINRIKTLMVHQNAYAEDIESVENLLSQRDIDQLMLEHNALSKVGNNNGAR